MLWEGHLPFVVRLERLGGTMSTWLSMVSPRLVVERRGLIIPFLSFQNGFGGKTNSRTRAELQHRWIIYETSYAGVDSFRCWEGEQIPCVVGSELTVPYRIM